MEPDDDIATDIAYNNNKYNRDGDIIRSVMICVRTSPCEMDIYYLHFYKKVGS